MIPWESYAIYLKKKHRIFEGPDKEAYKEYCATLKKAGIRIQAFEVNQRTLKCTGNCGSCPAMKSAAMRRREEDAELGYRKLGRGCSDNLLNEPGEERLFTIFVKKSEEKKALDLLGLGAPAAGGIICSIKNEYYA